MKEYFYDLEVRIQQKKDGQSFAEYIRSWIGPEEIPLYSQQNITIDGKEAMRLQKLPEGDIVVHIDRGKSVYTFILIPRTELPIFDQILSILRFIPPIDSGQVR